jgi:hypothetical protein
MRTNKKQNHPNSEHSRWNTASPSTKDERARQLADIAATGDEDNSSCAAADLAREFPSND